MRADFQEWIAQDNLIDAKEPRNFVSKNMYNKSID